MSSSLADAKREVARGSAWGTVSWIVTSLTGPALAVLLVRTMSHREFGALSVATDAIGVAAVLVSMGLGPALSQLAVSQRVTAGIAGERSAVRATVRLATRSSLVALPLVGLLAIIFAFDKRLQTGFWPLCVLAPVVVAAPLNGTALGACRALGRPGLLAKGIIAGALGTAVAVLAVVLLGHPAAVGVAGAFDLRPLVTLPLLAIPLLRWCRSQQSEEAVTEPVQSRAVVTLAISYMLAMIFGTLVSQLDVVVLGAARGARLVGLYSPASAMGNFALGIPLIVGMFFQPPATRLIAERSHSRLQQLYWWANRAGLALGAPFVVTLIVCPGSLLNLVFGPSLAVEALPLRVLGVGALVAALFGFNAIALDAYGLVRLTVVRLASLVLLSIAACAVLVPAFGALGAAWATTAAVIAENLLCSTALYHRLRISPWDGRAVAVAAGVAASIGVGFAMVHLVTDDLLRCLVVAGSTLLLTGAAFVAAAEPAERQALIRTLIERTSPFAARPAQEFEQVDRRASASST